MREFAKLGLTRSVGGVLALALSRELTPVVTAIILAGRVGSAFAAELGTMQARAGMGAGGRRRCHKPPAFRPPNSLFPSLPRAPHPPAPKQPPPASSEPFKKPPQTLPKPS